MGAKYNIGEAATQNALHFHLPPSLFLVLFPLHSPNSFNPPRRNYNPPDVANHRIPKEDQNCSCGVTDGLGRDRSTVLVHLK